MEWISAFIKDLKVSKILNFSVFLTSGLLLFLPRTKPEISLINVPEEYIFPLYGIFVFSFVLSLLWLMLGLKKLITKFYISSQRKIKSFNLTKEEQDMLATLGEKYADNYFDYSHIKGDKKLYLIKVLNSLESKGLLEKSFFPDQVVLTKEGQSKALELIDNSN